MVEAVTWDEYIGRVPDDARYAVPNLFFQAYSMPAALRPDAVSPAG